MARPRKPSKILEFSGAFKKHPDRRREDHPGVGAFNRNPPARLPRNVVPAWHEVVERVPLDIMSGSDELAVEIAARLLANYWETSDMDVLKELRQWFLQLGLTPTARTKIPAPKKSGSGNLFADL